MSTTVKRTGRQVKANVKTPTKRAVNKPVRPPRPTVLEEIAWYEDVLSPLKMEIDIPEFDLKRNDIIWVHNDGPVKGDVIFFSVIGRDRGPYFARFLEWEWDEMLVTWADKLRFFRPHTVAVIKGVERDGQYSEARR